MYRGMQFVLLKFIEVVVGIDTSEWSLRLSFRRVKFGDSNIPHPVFKVMYSYDISVNFLCFGVVIAFYPKGAPK